MSRSRLIPYLLYLKNGATATILAESYARADKSVEFFVKDQVTFQIPSSQVIAIEEEKREDRKEA